MVWVELEGKLVFQGEAVILSLALSAHGIVICTLSKLT